MNFNVRDTMTGQLFTPDCSFEGLDDDLLTELGIYRRANICGFALSQDDGLMLLDSLGRYYWLDDDRFKVEFVDNKKGDLK